VLERLGEEPTGDREIPFLGHKHVDNLAELVDRLDSPVMLRLGKTVSEPCRPHHGHVVEVH
jgi:hypothetical protein